MPPFDFICFCIPSRKAMPALGPPLPTSSATRLVNSFASLLSLPVVTMAFEIEAKTPTAARTIACGPLTPKNILPMRP